MQPLKHRDLRKFVQACFEKCGLTPEESKMASAAIMHAEERGFETHGIKNLFRIYLPQLVSGVINSRGTVSTLKKEAATVLLDGKSALGLNVGARAMKLAVKKAKTFGIGAVGVSNCTHFGCASFHTLIAARHGCIGIALSNLGSQVVAPPPRGKTRLLGTNPLSIAAPAHKMPPFCLDMSTTVVSTGQIYKAEQRGERIPEGWLRDTTGEWTTDPSAYRRGAADLVFLGGHPSTGSYKGFGLALMVDILSGALTGSGVGPRPDLLNRLTEKHLPPGNDIGQFFIAINVESFRPLAEFTSQMDSMLATIVRSEAINGCPVSYPGYWESRLRRKHLSEGFKISPVIFSEMQSWAQRLNLSLPNSVEETLQYANGELR